MADDADQQAFRGTAAERRAARASWPVRKFRLGDEPADDFSACTVAERLAMTWQMTCDAWASAGRPQPRYARSATPVRVLRGGTPPRERQDGREA